MLYIFNITMKKSYKIINKSYIINYTLFPGFCFRLVHSNIKKSSKL